MGTLKPVSPDKKFYDLHFHAMNISHPNLGAFIHRLKLDPLSQAAHLLALGGWAALVSLFHKARIQRVRNLLTLMEHDLGAYFLILEKGLETFAPHIVQNAKILIANEEYEKIVLTPLIMDFGSKGLDYESSDASGSNMFKLSQKPIREQVLDLLYGIQTYVDQGTEQIFEIYPFLGLNPANYTVEQIQQMLEKYFDGYGHNETDLLGNMGKFDKNFNKDCDEYCRSRGCDKKIDHIRRNSFIGVKVYPPLGFDPWPVENPVEMEKVCCLYNYCTQHHIPITAHCSDGGFVVIKKSESLQYSAPSKWKEVLQGKGGIKDNHQEWYHKYEDADWMQDNYADLTLNLAHFGFQKNRFLVFPQKKWAEEIIELMVTYENVYADFGYRGVDEGYYEKLHDFITTHDSCERIKEKLLFGSDFMINLFDVDSYNQYLDNYSRTDKFTTGEKRQFHNLNPRKFLGFQTTDG